MNYYIPQWDSPLPVVMTWSNGGDIIDGEGNVNFDTPEFAAAVERFNALSVMRLRTQDQNEALERIIARWGDPPSWERGKAG